MNNITKLPLDSLGYNFIKKQYLPKGKDEYYLRNLQNRNGTKYRQLSAFEIEVLVRNRNTSDNWNNILVSDHFNPELVKNCKFYGLVRIGKLEPFFLSFSDLKVAVGLYDSTIISSDIGDNSVINNVHYLSHYIIGQEVILTNINEIQTTDICKFGNGIIKEGEQESVRIWLEICNENGGRKILPFNGMLPGDAWLWSKYRDDDQLLERFKQLTETEFKTARGFYGKIGDRTVIKNSNIIKDVWIGSDAYIKGANKLKNLTINSGEEGRTQIGEGCELVNGSVGFGSRIFYGVKAVRFVTASHTQLKYGARLINSYMGSNATISCCEVLNSLIFPGHEQHHNNSFLCASTIMGQSNIPAGATIGSNHNSRGADGEIVAGRGFWPALCVSLKHNCKFASFTMLAKGDYNYELNIPLPFSLISIHPITNSLIIMPGYWFMYNMYALKRNAWKYGDRDQRKQKPQYLEFDFLAPDTVGEILEAIRLLEKYTGRAYYKAEGTTEPDEEALILKGKELLNDRVFHIESLTILADGIENAKRNVEIIKVRGAYECYQKMVRLYGYRHLFSEDRLATAKNLKALLTDLPSAPKRQIWLNVGGQLIPEKNVESLKDRVRNGKIHTWDELHDFYTAQGEKYPEQKRIDALAALTESLGISLRTLSREKLQELATDYLEIQKWMVDQIVTSRKKDYSNAYRKMMYSNQEEMEAVVGKLSDNGFIKDQKKALKQLTEQLSRFIG
ncbi:DUF4954 family protein [Arachidicoccus terrestris]|uniref:DUF4954 family protein n=1 Tax=Arachidicoccus terrestris TaxID=2875539 RepID=UPI001CC63D64|nr:DUF4954 family protein [Arachidicoccus terrestris]UAY54815.1 DUF4954 family protein [Arachidicoccus terrestris]